MSDMALPWARPVPTEEAKDSACHAQADPVPDQAPSSAEGPGPTPLKAVTLQDVSLSTGDEIQVRWELTEENDEGKEESKVVWWDAKVLGEASTGTSSEGSLVFEGPRFEIQYAPRETFEAETAVVGFTQESHLLIAADQEGKPAMFWRKKGDEWEPSPEDLEGVEDEEYESDEEADNADPSLAQLRAAGLRPSADGTVGLEAILQMIGGPPREGDNQDLDNLDAFQQRIVAGGMRSLFDSIDEVIKEAGTSDSDGKVVVTEDMVKEMFARATRKRKHGE